MSESDVTKNSKLPVEACSDIIISDGERMAEALAELGQLLAGEQWENIIKRATNFLESGFKAHADGGAIYLHRGRAYLKLNELEQARKDLRQASELNSVQVEASDLLLQVLYKAGLWEELIAALDGRLEQSPGLIELLLQKANALRYLGRQDEALNALDAVPSDPSNFEFVRLYAALLCDIGDFEGALELVVPATSPLKTAPHLLLVLRGWAHQNCEGEHHTRDAECVYRQALMLNADDRWSRKGLANALRRLNRHGEAYEHYETVIRYVTEQKSRSELNPYDSCLAGWCYYCIGQFKKGADFCSAGLSALGGVAAAQFDYGLILLADSSFEAAQDQFDRSILELTGKNCLRRCGLLYVALNDLRDARARHDAVAQAAETYTIQTSLMNALDETLNEFSPRWSYLRERMQVYLNSARQDTVSTEARLAAMMSRALGANEWRWFKISGFSNDWSRPCAISVPILIHQQLPGKFYTLLDSVSLADLGKIAEVLNEDTAQDNVVQLALEYPADSTSRILWLSKEMLDAVGPEVLDDSTNRVQWEEITTPANSWAGVTTLQTAESLLDSWARQLISTSVELMIEQIKLTGNVTVDSAARLSELALAAALDEHLIYLATRVFGAAGGFVQSPRVCEIQPRITEYIRDDLAALEKSISEFKKLVLLRASSEGLSRTNSDEGGSDSQALAEESLSPSERLRKSVLDRARAIAEVPDREEQNRLAVEAAADMQIVVPLTDALESSRIKLADSLHFKPEFYLEDNESILLMSREPAFYASSVLLKASRPLVHSLSFLTATRRMQEAGIKIPIGTVFQTK